MEGKTPRLAVIIPAHNEAGNLGECLKSFARQTRRPDALIVVDDHSTDRTGALAQAFAEGHPWVRVVRRRSGPEHRPGAKVVESFRFGLETLAEPFDFSCWDVYSRVMDYYEAKGEEGKRLRSETLHAIDNMYEKRGLVAIDHMRSWALGTPVAFSASRFHWVTRPHRSTPTSTDGMESTTLAR